MTDRAPARLAGVRLRVSSLERSVAFYRDQLGMEVRHEDGETLRLGFGSDRERLDASLVLRESTPSRAPGDEDTYWKIGVTVADLDVARHQLVTRGLSITAPAQFLDIGYLCHLRDPDGYAIELLQHDFEADHHTRPPTARTQLGTLATLGQITLRVADADHAVAFYRELGMRLLSRQVVTPYRFTLYFLAFTSEQPPDPDLDAVTNRPWLWRRPYTTLELQHRWTGDAPRASEDAGFEGLSITEAGRSEAESVTGPGETPILLEPGA